MSRTHPNAEREHDVVVFGATGFVGKLTAAYLARQAPDGTRDRARPGAPSPSSSRPAPSSAGAAADWPLIVADSQRRRGAGARSRRRPRSSPRPSAPTSATACRWSQACAAAGTHYADLTGEVLFMRRSIDTARRGGAGERRADRPHLRLRLDPLRPRRARCCTAHAQATGGGDLEDTTLVVSAMRGGVSGGHDRLAARPARRGQAQTGAAPAAAGRPVRAEPGPLRRARPWPRARPDRRRPRRRRSAAGSPRS